MESTENGKNLYYLKKIFKYAAILIVLFFLLRSILDNLDQINQYPFHIDYLFLLISLLVILMYLFLQALLWKRILISLGVNPTTGETLRAFSLALFGKYIPGKVWVAAVRITELKSAQGKKEAAVSSIILEHIYIILSGVLFFIAIWGSKTLERLGLPVPQFIVIFSLVTAVAIHPSIMLRIGNFSLKLFKKEPISVHFSFRDSMGFLLLYTTTWIFLSLGIWSMVRAITQVSIIEILTLGSAFAFSVVAGFLALFAPGGLGVREGLFVLLISEQYPVYIAVIIAFCLRLAFTAAEILGLIIVAGISKVDSINSKKKKNLL